MKFDISNNGFTNNEVKRFHMSVHKMGNKFQPFNIVKIGYCVLVVLCSAPILYNTCQIYTYLLRLYGSLQVCTSIYGSAIYTYCTRTSIMYKSLDITRVTTNNDSLVDLFYSCDYTGACVCFLVQLTQAYVRSIYTVCAYVFDDCTSALRCVPEKA